jgi:drug/metabolite transporter (DMT)-like permease
LFWIPLRAAEQHGLNPGWATLAQFVAPLAILVPLALVRLVRGKPTGVAQFRRGPLIGAVVALYLESLLLTDVARALILFYAMPAWGTILEGVVMRRPLTRLRLISLLLSLAGMLTILGFFLCGSVAALVLSLLPLAALAPWLLLAAAGFLISVISGIYWGSRNVDPGRPGILLLVEAVMGIASAALLAGEPFGAPQAIGAALVMRAGIVDVIGNTRAAPAEAETE